ncbi:MAG: dihydrodipicolinate synthase family protein [Lewinellaceae bacterium]|nr:dihydrodipicolinate synthase family protein [Lewinellaceae bacterium]
MEKLNGLIAAPFTPMDDNGELALEKIERLVSLYEKNGVAGSFICGSTGEGVSLTFEEKRQVMEQWGKVKGDKVKALFMLGGTCLKEMQHLAIHAKECGLDGISILCPFYFKPASEVQLVEFCRQVADTVPGMPFYYYHIPALTGGHFSMARFLALADGKIPNLAGIKFTAPDIMDYHACRMFKNGKYDMLWGIDEALLSGLAAGAEGAVGSTYNYAAPLYNKIIKAFQNKDFPGAERLQQSSVRMVELLVKYGGTGAGKAFMKLIGLDCGQFRLPVSSPSADKIRELERELQEIGFFDFCSKI